MDCGSPALVIDEEADPAPCSPSLPGSAAWGKGRVSASLESDRLQRVDYGLSLISKAGVRQSVG